MTETALEKARNMENLKKSPKKEKVFAVKNYDYLNNHQVVYVDLRNGFSIYGYDGYGESLEIDRSKIPQEVKDLENHVMAEDSASLGEFTQ